MKNRDGFVLIFSLVITALILLVALSFQLIASNDLSIAKASSDSIRAHYIADAGIAKKFSQIRSGSTSSLPSESFTLATGYSGTVSVNVTQVQAPPFTVYRLDSTGTYNNAVRRVSLTIRQSSFARFAYFSNSENMLYWWWKVPIWFTTRDKITGELYTNDTLNIYGDPLFEGDVSSVGSTINYYHGGPPLDNPQFMQALNLGAPPIAFPTSGGIISDIRNAAQGSGSYYTGDTTVILMPDGTMYTQGENDPVPLGPFPLPASHALFVDNGGVNINGTLNGQLTVGTTGNIVITGNLLYNTNPRDETTPSTDMLGLVAGSNVIVSSSAPYDLEIDAYIMALNESFTIENYWTGLKGTLTIYGGITQKVRGPIGTFNPSTNEKASGYTKDYYYDERFEEYSPYYFPPAVDPEGRIVYKKLLWGEG